MALIVVCKQTKRNISPTRQRESLNQNSKLLVVYRKISRQSCLLRLFTNCRRISPAVTNILKKVQVKMTGQNTC